MDNIEGVFVRDLPRYFEEYYLQFRKFEDIAELIDHWGLLYNGEPKVDNRQVLDYMKKRKEKDEARAKRYLTKKGRMRQRQGLLDELKCYKVSQMRRSVRMTAEILYRTGHCEVVI
ncbi:hypothetical protein [Streptococcus sp. zg-JUN1979]|uniref:hypothetical protein n=1 Tax=Streptococcus sp. zg-JUN1979 TaxID=3391450 RepID=UPI0039A46BB5